VYPPLGFLSFRMGRMRVERSIPPPPSHPSLAMGAPPPDAAGELLGRGPVPPAVEPRGARAHGPRPLPRPQPTPLRNVGSRSLFFAFLFLCLGTAQLRKILPSKGNY